MESYYNKYNLIYDQEYEYWQNNILDKWIKVDILCQNCGNNSLKEKKFPNSINNPIKLKCGKRICRKKAFC